jgi:hypothetical protein
MFGERHEPFDEFRRPSQAGEDDPVSKGVEGSGVPDFSDAEDGSESIYVFGGGVGRGFVQVDDTCDTVVGGLVHDGGRLAGSAGRVRRRAGRLGLLAIITVGMSCVTM